MSPHCNECRKNFAPPEACPCSCHFRGPKPREWTLHIVQAGHAEEGHIVDDACRRVCLKCESRTLVRVQEILPPEPEEVWLHRNGRDAIWFECRCEAGQTSMQHKLFREVIEK